MKAIDMLKTMEDIEELDIHYWNRASLQMWVAHAQYAFETNRAALGNQLAILIADDFDFVVTMKEDSK